MNREQEPGTRCSHSVLTDDYARVLDCLIGEQQLAANGSCRGVGQAVLDQSIQPTGLGQRVIIQEDEVIA